MQKLIPTDRKKGGKRGRRFTWAQVREEGPEVQQPNPLRQQKDQVKYGRSLQDEHAAFPGKHTGAEISLAKLGGRCFTSE